MSKGTPISKYERKIKGCPPSKYSDQEIIELGERLLAWMQECDNDPNCDVVHLSEFYAELEGFGWTEWQNLCQRSHMALYYQQARDWMLKRTMKNQKLPTAYGSRFLGIYSSDVRDHEKQLMKEKIDYEYDKKLATEKALQIPPNDDVIKLQQKHLEEKAALQREIDELKRQART